MIGLPPKRLAAIWAAPFASLGDADRRTAERHGCNLRVGRGGRCEATKQKREQFWRTDSFQGSQMHPVMLRR
jgi:hypothetical protein